MRAAASRAFRATGTAAARQPRPAGPLAHPGGARRHLRRWDKAPRAARVPHTASLVTEPLARGHETLGDVLAQVTTDVLSAAGPPSLDTAHGHVLLSGSDLRSFRAQPSVDASIRNLRTTLLNDGSAKTSAAELGRVRGEIMDYFHKTFTLSEKLHEVFASASAFFEKHERLRHPPIFYLGHTASFYINKLHLGKFISNRIDPVLEMQMAVGVDEMSWDDLDSKSYVWPSGAAARADEARAAAFLQKVLDFRCEVRLLVDDLMRSQPLQWPIAKDSFWWVIMMGIEHERIHLETSSVIHRQASLDCVQPSAAFPLCSLGRFHSDPNSVAAQSMPANRLVPIDRGSTRVGRSWEGTKTYGWDNEFGTVAHLEVPAFAASEYLVSNKEYLDFVEAGGYSTERYWSEEGWRWVSDMRPTAPRFWAIRNGSFHLRTLCHEVPMPWDWPAEVCHHEAAAFCKYLSEKTGKSLRLPMEDEYLRLRDSVPTDLQDSEHGRAWGVDVPGNVNLAHWASPCPVDTFKSPLGVYDVLGNVWQHSATHIDVLDGFTTHPLYDDFTTPTVGGEHSRIMGGSWMSTGANGATRDSRLGFRRHFYQHAGFRYIESEREVSNSASPYERDSQLCNAFRFHFDEPASGDNYHGRLAEACMEVLRKLGRQPRGTKALELGCGPGRTTLELARHGVAAAHGADRSAKGFQCTAQRLLAGAGRLRWCNYLEGEHVATRELAAAELGLGAEGCAKAQAVQFFQVPDFAAVDTQKFHDYDLLLCAQPGVLSSSDALGLLSSAHRVLKPGGLLVVGTQYEWPATGDTAGMATSGEQVLAAALQPWFDPVASSMDLPFLRTETARKSEQGLQHLTFWERRAEVRPGQASPTGLRAQQHLHGAGQATYGEAATIGQYLDFHYGPKSEYPAACAARCIQVARDLGVPLGRALEVGGGPGRAAVELSRAFGHVDAGDYSRRFVELARQLVREGELRWHVLVDQTSGQTVERTVRAGDLQVGSISFSQMDAQALPQDLRGYDLVCGFNLLDRLARPRDFLCDVRSRLNPGGLLVLSSPYTWLEEFTAKDQWLGGYKYGDNDGPSTYTGLKELLLAQSFVEARSPEDVCFRLDELDNGRKSQQTRAQMTFWQLRTG